MSADGGPVELSLVPQWDATLTYSLLRGREQEPGEGPLFVGRRELVGSLVDAIGKPQQRDTYLISGYRGAGKTSLVIEAARRARPKLADGGYELLPLVLNVSEVSASLDPTTEAATPALQIDARRLLTALLRTLRNALERRRDDERVRALAERVTETCRIAEAAQYTARAQLLEEQQRTRRAQTVVGLNVANLLGALAAVLGLAAAAVQGIVLLEDATVALQALAVALAGAVVLAVRASVVTRRESRRSSTTSTELVFDNSLQQVESELKEILDELDTLGMRTIFVLEELDKVDDDEGQQLDRVIRYFKNLFTQAPALFFFVTDKGYYDLVERRIAAGRRRRTYAVEHTFFTHRVFVGRPRLEECLEYLGTILEHPDLAAAVDRIRGERDMRVRRLPDMAPLERFLRVLLLAADNHLFDLKNELRRFVAVEGGRSRVVFDETSFPPWEQDLAALHFVLEQKTFLYDCGVDYANEVLRDCLSSLLAGRGTDDPQTIADFFPAEGDGASAGRMRIEDRDRVREGVHALLGDLVRGGAVERASAGTFRWRPAAASVFSPIPEFEPHEQQLAEKLQRARRILRLFEPGGVLEPVAGSAGATAPGAAERCDAMIQRLNQAARPLTAEDAQQMSAVLARDLGPVLHEARAAHLARRNGFTPHSSSPSPLPSRSDGARWLIPAMVTPPASVLLVYGPQDELPGRDEEALPSDLVAVVLVDDDPGGSEEAARALARDWRDALGARPSARHADVLVLSTSLAEGLLPGAPSDRWGELATDELEFAALYAEALARPVRAPRPVWLRDPREGERRHPALEEAVRAWLAAPEPLLVAPPSAGCDVEELERAFASLAASADAPRLLVDGARRPLGDSVHRLLSAGRVVPALSRAWIIAPPPPKAVLWGDTVPDELAGLPVSVLRAEESEAAVAAAEALLPAAPAAAERPALPH